MLLSMKELKTRKREKPDWIITGFLKRGGKALLQGEPKRACKSWILLNGLWNLSEGKPFIPLYKEDDDANSHRSLILAPPRPLNVVYFTQEDTEDDLKDRTEVMSGRGNHTNNDRFFVVPKNLDLYFDGKKGMDAIKKHLNEAEERCGSLDLIAFDPMRRFHSQTENDSDVIARLWHKVDELNQKYNSSAFFAHHIARGSGEYPPDFYSACLGRGSTDIGGGGDAFINIKPVHSPKQKIERKVEAYFVTKRGRESSPVRLKVSFETGQVEFLGYIGGRGEKSEEKEEKRRM